MVKNSSPLLALLLASLATGCAQASVPATLEHVGPASNAAPAAGNSGNLIVYSAYETGAPSPTEIDTEVRHHSDYEIRHVDGQLVTKVKNRAAAFGDSPATVSLPPGNYQLVVRSNGSGLLTLPLTVAAQRVTALHLEGTVTPPASSAPTGYDAIRTTSGKVVGWATTSK